jgi:Rad3-related DNA helicase
VIGDFLRDMAAHYGITPAPEQIEYAETFRASVSKGHNALLQLDAGGGKTIGYCAPSMFLAAEANKPIIIATSTSSNRTAILDDLEKIKAYARAIGHPIADLPVLDYNSARDFCSERRISVLLDRVRAVRAPNEVIAQLTTILEKVQEDPSKPVLAEDVLPEPIFYKDRPYITREDITIAPAERRQPFTAEKARMLIEHLNKASIILVTQAMLAKHRVIRKYVREDRIAAIVLDEVDRLLSMDFLYNASVKIVDLEFVLERMEQAYDLDVRQATRAFQALYDAVTAARVGNATQVMVKRETMVQQVCDAVTAGVETMVKEFTKLIVQFSSLDGIATNVAEEHEERLLTYQLDEIVGGLENFKENFLPEYPSETFRIKNESNVRLFIRWDASGEASLHVATASAGRSVRWLFAKNQNMPIILTTGKVGTTSQQFAAQLGTSPSLFSKEFKIARFGQMTFTYYRGMPEPIVNKAVSPVYLEAVATELRNLYLPGQRMLVLCSSYADVEFLYNTLREHELPVLRQRRGSDDLTLLRRQLVLAPGILITVNWEGYNIVSDEPRPDKRRGLLDTVVISRLPFAYPDTMVEETLESLYGTERARGMSWLNKSAEVTRRLYQGICRGIRGPHDRCDVVFLDPRMPPPAELVRKEPLMAPRVTFGEGYKQSYQGLVDAIPARFVHNGRNFKLRQHNARTQASNAHAVAPARSRSPA